MCDHCLAVHQRHGPDGEGEEGGEEDPEAGHEEAVDTLETVEAAHHHVQPAHQQGGHAAPRVLDMVEVTGFWWSLCSYHKGGHLVVHGDHAEEDCEDVELAQFAGPPASRGQHQQQAHRGQGRPTHREIIFTIYTNYTIYTMLNRR